MDAAIGEKDLPERDGVKGPLRTDYLIALLLLSAVLLHLPLLTRRSLWFDEACSWQLIQFPWSELVQRVTGDSHPPLYFLLLKLWRIVAGDCAFSLRGFSLLATAGFLFVADRIVVEVARRFPGMNESRAFEFRLSTLLFLVANGLVFRHAEEARMYPLACLFASAATLFLLRLERNPTSRANFFFLLTFDLCFTYTHYYSAFFLFAQMLGAGLVWRRPVQGEGSAARRDGTFFFQRTTIVVGLTGAAFLPWLPTFLQQQRMVQQAFWIRPAGYWTLSHVWANLWFFTEPPLKTHFFDLAATALTLGVAANAIVRAPQIGLLLGTSAIVPPILALGFFCATGRAILVSRYILFTTVPLAVLLAMLCSALPTTARRLATAALCLAFAWCPLDLVRQITAPGRDGVRGAVDFLQRSVQPGDAVVFGNTLIFYPAKHYAGGRLPLTQIDWPDSRAIYNGANLAVPADFVVPEQVTRTPGTLWLAWTTGFNAVQWTNLWKDRRLESTETFVETFPWQGEILIHKYEKVRTAP